MYDEGEEALVPGDEDETELSDVEPDEENPEYSQTGTHKKHKKKYTSNRKRGNLRITMDSSNSDQSSEEEAQTYFEESELQVVSTPIISHLKKTSKKDNPRSTPSIRPSSPMKLSRNIKRKTTSALRRSSADSAEHRKTRRKMSIEPTQTVLIALFSQFKQVCLK